jgi:hypothetical protein
MEIPGHFWVEINSSGRNRSGDPRDETLRTVNVAIFH